MIKNDQCNFATIGLLTTRVLLSIICTVHLYVMAGFLFRQPITPWLFPASLVTATGFNFLFVKSGADKKLFTIALGCSIILIIVSLLLSWFYFDFSWDGQWYQQAAIYDIAGKWNPILHSMELPDKTNQLSVLHFPKTGWYFAAAVLRLFGSVEPGKAYNFMLLFAAWGAVYSLCRNFKIACTRSIVLTTLVLINPVVFSEITTYLNDGDLYLLMVIYLACIILWLRNYKNEHLVIAGMAAICLVNTKFTGLVFLSVTLITLFIYVLAKKKDLIKSYVISHIAIMFLSVAVFGFNPYVTNLMYRGNPLFPLIGTKNFPGVFDKGSDDNEAYETPKNMVGKSLVVRLCYANFGQPGNAPYNGEDNAILGLPFATRPSTWSAYRYHETRVSGFGPYFGIVLVFLLIALPFHLTFVRSQRLSAVLFLTGLCSCISLSRHFWWPRFFPLLWLAPILFIFLLWAKTNDNVNEKTIINRGKLRTVFNWLLPLMMAANGLIVASVHLRWETSSSLALRAELLRLQHQQKTIEVDYGYFKRSVEEKLEHWHISYKPATLKASDKSSRMLTSVVEGYPNVVLYR